MVELAPLIASTDGFVARQMIEDGTPGLALAVTDRDGLLFAREYGVADLATRQPVTPETLFEIGSIGKSFTAVLALQMREAGLLDVDQPVTRYLPWFDVKSRFESITIHHLLSHTAGITSGLDTRPEGAAEVRALRHTETGSAPGTRFHYSNVGYKALGLVLSRLTGQSYGDLLRERILAPLAMSGSTPTITHAMRKRLAVGYVAWYDDRPSPPGHALAPGTWVETDTADGSIAASASDLAAFARLLLRRGDGPNGRLLEEESFARLTTPVIAGWGDYAYGYGLTIREEAGCTIVGHPGGAVGYVASLQADLDTGIGVVVLANGPAEPYSVSQFVIQTARAAINGGPLPEGSGSAEDEPADLAAYAGTYVCISEGKLAPVPIQAAGATLTIRRTGTDGVGPSLTPYWDDDTFVVADSASDDWDRFVIRFERDDAGQVIDLVHGPDHYRREGIADTPFDPAPAEWMAYSGHYRAFTPWCSNFRVVLRRGRLWMIWPEDPDGFADEAPLIPLDDGSFRVGDDPGGPERIRFTAVVDGHALEAIVSGGAYHRSFTP